MYWQKSLNCLYFNDYSIVYKHVQAISVVQFHSVVMNGNQLLGHDLVTGFTQLVSQAGSIDALEKPWSKF